MREISEIDAPKLWKIESSGGTHDSGSIKDWFLFPFDCYFIYQHPIVIDLDYLVEVKY
jgi:hypothetical protein